jgi:PleD family two-component response regulator
MKMAETIDVENEALCTEDYFQQRLIREREQTEKSGRHFMLVLLDVGELFNKEWSDNADLLQKTGSALNASTREIDLKGWYLKNTLIGIICPGIDTSDKRLVIDKIRQEINAFLEPPEAAAVKIYTIFYSNIEETGPVIQN